MNVIPLNTTVVCADGPCGECVAAVISRASLCVTHLVVRVTDEGFPSPNQRLVGLELVDTVDTSETGVRLSCAKADLAGLEPFTQTHWVNTPVVAPQPYGYVDAYSMPYTPMVENVDVPVEDEIVPAGEVVVHWDTIVRATDGEVGTVGQLLVDPDNKRITHFVLEESRVLRGPEAVTLPISVVDHLEGDALYLKLDTRAISSLPRIPVKRGKEESDRKRVEIVAKFYEDTTGASNGLKQLKDLHRSNTLTLMNAAVLIKEADGRTSLKDDRDLDPGKSRLTGAIAGGLVGLLAGPLGAVVGAAVGLGAGQAAAGAIDMGFSDHFLKALQAHLKPGTSALIVVVENQWVSGLAGALHDQQGVMFQQQLTDEMVEKFLAGSEPPASV